MIKLVVLDIDDTLTLSERIWFGIESRIAKKMGLPPIDRKLYREIWGTPLRESVAKRIPKKAVGAFIEEMKRITPELVAKGKVDTINRNNLWTLDKIKATGKKLAILTSREFFEVEHFLKPSHPLSKTIEAFYYRDNSIYLKPDPRVFEQILGHFKVRPDEAVYVGDTLNDALCAKGAGLYFIAVLENGIKTKEDFASVPVDFFANSFPDILEYINRH